MFLVLHFLLVKPQRLNVAEAPSLSKHASQESHHIVEICLQRHQGLRRRIVSFGDYAH
jgi:hypothetical protein